MTGLGKLEDRLFKAPYLCGGALVLVAVSALDLAWGYASRQWFVDKGGGFRLLDFACLWSGGDLALRKSAIDAYDYLSMSAAQRDLLGIIVPDVATFAGFIRPYCFSTSCPSRCFPMHRRFSRGPPQRPVFTLRNSQNSRAALGDFRGPGTGVVAENILLGQTGFLTAGFMGFALVLMERAPFRAGVVLGLLAYRPQLGLLFPSSSWPLDVGGCCRRRILRARSRRRRRCCLRAGILACLRPLPLGSRSMDAEPGRRIARNVADAVRHRQSPGFDLRIAWAAQIVVAAFTAAFV